MAKDRLDVHLGSLRQQLDTDAAALNKAPGELLRDSYQLWRLGQSLLAGEVAAAVLDLAHAIAPDERSDPAEERNEDAALSALARLLGSAYAAQGIRDALTILWTTRNLMPHSGLVLGSGYLADLDELIDQAERPHTRETMIEKLIEEARKQ